MSTLVTNELFVQPGRGDDVASLLLEILGESLQWGGCETIRIVRPIQSLASASAGPDLGQSFL